MQSCNDIARWPDALVACVIGAFEPDIFCNNASRAAAWAGLLSVPAAAGAFVSVCAAAANAARKRHGTKLKTFMVR